MADSLIYKLTSGKPIKALYMIRSYAALAVPSRLYRSRRKALLAKAARRSDYAYMVERASYYCRLREPAPLPAEPRGEHKGHMYVFVGEARRFRPGTFHKVYYFDLHEVMRYFGRRARVGYVPGDVRFTPDFPAIVKSRLLGDAAVNAVLLKLNKHRHFIFVHDEKRFDEKRPMAIFRGRIRQSRLREQFMRMYFGSAICDCGIVGPNPQYPQQWVVPKKTIREHLDYQYIIALEGNDVASNLKWVMSSNSIAVMTRPTCETWFMEGRLVAGYHYIEIKDDLSDLEAKLRYYSSHVDEARSIIEHAHEHVRQFADKRRERLIELLVAERYLAATLQSDAL